MLEKIYRIKASIVAYNNMRQTILKGDDIALVKENESDLRYVFFHVKEDGTVPNKVFFALKEVIAKELKLEFICCYSLQFLDRYPEFKEYVKIRTESELFIEPTQINSWLCSIQIFYKTEMSGSIMFPELDKTMGYIVERSVQNV